MWRIGLHRRGGSTLVSPMLQPTRQEFCALARAHTRPGTTLAIPVGLCLLADHLTPVLAYRRLVAPDERTAPSFLFESVEGGERQGRYSILGAQPAIELVAYGPRVRITVHRPRLGLAQGAHEQQAADPLEVVRGLTARVRFVRPPEDTGGPPLPRAVAGGWFGYAAYDAVRYIEPDRLAHPPPDDRGLPDVHMALYDGIVIFDHVNKTAHAIELALLEPGADADASYSAATSRLQQRVEALQRDSRPLRSGAVDRESAPGPLPANISRARHAAMVARARAYIADGDIFQVVIGQRFERTSVADPFDVYRALRAVNPSPYMVYLQAEGCILVASSPEILCRVRREDDSPQAPLVITNRPLAGTRPRGRTAEADAALERELLADPKERAEHVMLVDLGRNDVGRVAVPGTIRLPALLTVERYSHVMHISSTITARLRPGLDCWDALRATLPAGTITGAPKIRAMQIIDELEPARRGPYGGGIGYVSLDGQMDIALALRTIVVPTALTVGPHWTYHIQAASGIVADSDPDAEYQETVSKAAALARAIDLAERVFAR